MNDSQRRSICTEARIEAPIEDVWRVLTDYARYAEWNPYLVQVDGSASAGTQIVAHAVDARGNLTVLDVEVRHVSPYEMNWVGGLPDRSAFTGDHWLILQADGSATRLSHVEHFSGTQMPAILDRYAASIEDNFQRMNAALKERCEAAAG